MKQKFHLLAKKEAKSKRQKRLAISKAIVEAAGNLSIQYGLQTTTLLDCFLTPSIPTKRLTTKVTIDAATQTEFQCYCERERERERERRQTDVSKQSALFLPF